MSPHHFARTLLAAAVFAALLYGCAGPRDELLLQPIEADRKLGLEVSRQIAAQIGIVDDAKRSSYVEAVGNRLAEQLPNKRFNYSFRIVDQPEPNAFATPGGVSLRFARLAGARDFRLPGRIVGGVVNRNLGQLLNLLVAIRRCHPLGETLLSPRPPCNGRRQTL